MFSKTTLSAAIAVALSMGIGTVAQAASFTDLSTITFNQCNTTTGTATTECVASTSTVTYAYEQFSTAEAKLDFPFRVRYRPASSNLGKGYDVYVNFTLSGEATWNGGLTTNNLTIQSQEGTTTTTPEVAIVAKGSTADSVVSFRINTSKTGALTTAQIIDFKFKLTNVQKALKTPGGQITLTAAFKVAQATDPTSSANKDADTPARTVSLASSVAGANLAFEYREAAKAYINVETDGKTFTGGGKKSDTEVDYGFVKFDSTSKGLKTASLLAQTGLFTASAAATDYWLPVIETFKLSIDTGNFSASGVPTDGKVYIDLGSGNKLKASTLSADKLTATWDYNSASDTAGLLVKLTAVGEHPIMLTVNGTDSINENRKAPPKGTLSIGYAGGGALARSATLRHLKRNGTVCTLYNIPNSAALDLVHLRITNDSAGTTGFVKGSLRDMDGTNVFKGKMLIDVGGLAPHQTVHLGMADLTSNGETWGGRGVLTLESNIPEPYMQVYALLRAAGLPDEFPESPLMNLSTGASGNGCD